MAFCSAALLGPGGSALGLMGFPFGIQREGPTLSTPSSAGGAAATVPAEAAGCGGCCCSTASVTKPWLRIRALKEVVKEGKSKQIKFYTDQIQQISFMCHSVLPDRSFRHLSILHSPCGGCEGGRSGDRRRQRRGGRGRCRHGDDGGRRCGGWAEGGDGDFLGLRGIFTTVGTEKHAAAVCPAAPASQHRHTTPVETVSDALVRAALKKCALREEKI